MGSLKKMKLAFAVFVAAASAVEWPNVDINYTYPQPLGMYPGEEKKQTTCAEVEAALMASENNSMHKTHLSLPYFKECADKCMEFQNMEITGGMGNQRCWSKDEITIAESARIESCWCNDEVNEGDPWRPDGTKKYPQSDSQKGSLMTGYMCLYWGMPAFNCDIRNLEDMVLGNPAEEACAEAQAKLDASDDFFERLGLQGECEEACDEFEDETCGFLINGISFALLALLAFLRN